MGIKSLSFANCKYTVLETLPLTLYSNKVWRKRKYLYFTTPNFCMMPMKELRGIEEMNNYGKRSKHEEKHFSQTP